MVLAAIGMVLVRKAVHSALLLATVMICLAVQYAAQDAPFLFAVQIIVYTGAILMLFLFVLMLVGVDASDSLVETIRGQRLLAGIAFLGFGVLLVAAVGNAVYGNPTGLAEAQPDGNPKGIAQLLFGKYVFAFEVTSALLITAAMGAMMLAHRERLTKKTHAARPRRGADPQVRRTGHPPRPAADAGCTGPAQRRRHAGAAAGRVDRTDLGFAGAPGTWHRVPRSRGARPDIDRGPQSVDAGPESERTPTRERA